MPSQVLRAPMASSEEHVIIRLAGGFVLNLEQSFSAAHRVGLLFSLPGSTMLDTLVGLLLGTCLSQARIRALHPTLWQRKGLVGIRGGGGGVTDTSFTKAGSSGVPLALLHFLNGSVLSDAAPEVLLPLLRRHVTTRHLRAYTLLLQFGAAAVPFERRKDAQLQLRQFGFLLVSRRFLTEQMQVHLVRALLQDGGARLDEGWYG